MLRHGHSGFARDKPRPSAQTRLYSIFALPDLERNNLSTLLGRYKKNLFAEVLWDMELYDFGGRKFVFHNDTPAEGMNPPIKGLTQMASPVLYLLNLCFVTSLTSELL